MRGASAVSSSEEFGRVLDFGSNDYLGLRRHPELREAIRSSTEHDGWGSGQARKVWLHFGTSATRKSTGRPQR